MRLWIIKKLIPHYTTKKGQDIAFKLWHWTTPHLEHAGYEWTIERAQTPETTEPAKSNTEEK